ncbi:MAG: type II secretion system F family protein [Rhizobiales bacterium]|nr:type II secretion system F family protein [Hyphomicrobiales bacterium]
MPNFRYRAMTQGGELVSGSITAPTAAEVANRIEFLGLVPIETVTEAGGNYKERLKFSLLSRPRAEDVTVFTRDLALLLKAGARIDDALDLLAVDIDIGRLRSVVAQIRGRVLAGESFSEALAHHPTLFPAMYVALVRVGEASGALDHILDVLGSERNRAEAMRRKVVDALRYPAFVLFAACGVLSFFLLFVIPQFAAVLQDFNAKLDPIVATLFGLSKFVRAHLEMIEAATIVLIVGGWLVFRRAAVRAKIIGVLTRLPLLKSVVRLHYTALFCRNLGILLGSGVALTTTLRILVDMLGSADNAAIWNKAVDRVRHGGKLSDALADTTLLPAMAIRMLRIGEETGQLPVLSGNVAEFYEAKLQRSLDRIVGITGPIAIIIISAIVGGLIVSVMTALLSVTQIIE